MTKNSFNIKIKVKSVAFTLLTAIEISFKVKSFSDLVRLIHYFNNNCT